MKRMNTPEAAVLEPAWATKVCVGAPQGSQVPRWSRGPVDTIGTLVLLGFIGGLGPEPTPKCRRSCDLVAMGRKADAALISRNCSD
jgi:hypothetical protein